ncbi:O-antigen ligase family protein [Cohnella faecalis]|uniref:O-antigen ligase domain-containing protein n=1 Tax=Cohnella faecalis TaxID=2315694 RepID=A0A398CQI4_9BACL|nr:O-antigen ligase family protein [Cohnella faecalis]RIE02077.1 O-antigen ligase domain-containing protein [Cohnella faecalis]
MSKKTEKARPSDKGPISAKETIPLRYWAVVGLSVLFLFWAPFQRALFNGNDSTFERPIYQSIVCASLILFGLALLLLSKWKLRSEQGWLSVGFWLIPAAYLLSLANAASQLSALNALYSQFLYGSMFLIGLYVIKDGLGNRIFQSAILASGYFIVLFGLFHWLGNGEAISSLVGWFTPFVEQGVYKDAVMTDSNGLRLASVFQYANTYAAFLIALLLCALFFTIKSSGWKSASLHAVWVVPILVSFWLTLSRGAIVVIAVVLIMLLLFLKPYRQLLLIAHLIVGSILTFTILGKVTSYGISVHESFSASLSAKGWLLLLAATALYTAAACAMQRFLAPWLSSKLERIDGLKKGILLIPVIAVVAGSLVIAALTQVSAIRSLLPANVETRLENINLAQHSVLERGTFYKDAMKLVADYPLIGAGGGAWSALFEKYQSNPYVSRQAHSFFFQYLTEVGIIGFIVIAAFLVAVFYFYIRRYFQSDENQRESRFLYFILALSLLTHSAIDFDLSYLYLVVLLFLCLGGMASGLSKEPSTSPLLPKDTKRFPIFPAILAVGSIAVLILSARLVMANSSFKEHLAIRQSSNDFNELMDPLDKALKLQPGHPEYSAYSIDLLNAVYQQTQEAVYKQDEQSILKAALHREPHNRQLIEIQLNDLIANNDIGRALQRVREALPDFPWDMQLYEKSFQLEEALSQTARESGDTGTIDKYWQYMLADYEAIKRNIDHLSTLPKEQNQGLAFQVTPQIASVVGSNYYRHGDYLAAEEALKPYIGDDLTDETNVTIIRWYLASLSKQGKTDQNLYDRLTSNDPSEADKIAEIVNAL